LILIAVMAPLVVATLVGVVLLWPGERVSSISERFGAAPELYDATVASVTRDACEGTSPEDEVFCNTVTSEVTEGDFAGRAVVFQVDEGPNAPDLETGDEIVLAYAPGAPVDLAFSFADYQRTRPLGVLAVLFAAAVIALGRIAGLRALAGVGVSLVVLVQFLLPSILEGNNPLAVAIVGASVVMFIALYLVHGLNVRTTAAVIGTLLSLTLTALLGVIFVGATRLTGLGDEEATILRAFAEQVDVRGLILAGIVIGSLGVLDDVTVTQVSAVWELHRANASMSLRELYAAAVRIGRDHIASTVNTLVLAYAGAALALLVLFVDTSRPLRDVLTGEVIAVEIVRTLVGSIGLVASVPITTLLAAVIVTWSHEHADTEEATEDILRP
jgi:uncharacterized membrane protein